MLWLFGYASGDGVLTFIIGGPPIASSDFRISSNRLFAAGDDWICCCSGLLVVLVMDTSSFVSDFIPRVELPATPLSFYKALSSSICYSAGC
jgi:hypothetical protein